MKFIAFLLTAGLFLLSPLVSFVYAQEEASPSPVAVVNSFELFWPISAGKVAGESMYSLKILKENVRGMFIFNAGKKVDYLITLAQKRTVEVEKLYLDKKDYTNAEETLRVLQDKWTDTTAAITKVDEQDQSGLEGTFKTSLEKERALLQYLVTQVPTENSQPLNDTLQKLNETLASL